MEEEVMVGYAQWKRIEAEIETVKRRKKRKEG